VATADSAVCPDTPVTVGFPDTVGLVALELAAILDSPARVVTLVIAGFQAIVVFPDLQVTQDTQESLDTRDLVEAVSRGTQDIVVQGYRATVATVGFRAIVALRGIRDIVA